MWRHLVTGFLLLPGSGEAVRIVTRQLPDAAVWRGYVARIEVAITSPCLASDSYLSAAGLPDGFHLSPVGVLEGFPRRAGEYPVRLQAVTPCGAASKEMVLRVLPAALLEVKPREIVVECPPGPPPQHRQVSVRATWRGLPYRVDLGPAKPPWLRVRPLLGVVPPEGLSREEDTVDVEVDAAKLSPGEYEARLRFWAEQAVQPEYVRVLVRVTPGN